MSSNVADGPDDRVADGTQQRYDELEIGNEEFIIYDRDNHQAWIQSSVAASVDR